MAGEFRWFIDPAGSFSPHTIGFAPKMWDGRQWLVCDGTQGTPDMRSRVRL